MNIKKFDTINIVPFIDIVLVLLMIVLVTASFVTMGIIPVELSTTEDNISIRSTKVLTITIKKDGKIFFDKQYIAKSNIQTELLIYPKSTNININCDKNAKFDNFVYILNHLKKNNFVKLHILTNITNAD